ncbi:hypothetical protein HK101_002223 [Irineochytrium annulatum]|nr:hypothetical protein HK101_002223 [Irineochytrium annulatum]
MDYTSFTSPPASPLAVAFNPVVVASRGRPAKRYMGSLSARMRHSRGSAEAPIDENLARAVTDRAGRLEERLRVALLGSTEAENNPELRRSLTHLQPADWHVAATLLIKEVTTLGWERAAREEDRVQSERLRRSPFGMRKQPSNASLTNGGVQRATGIEQGMDWELMAAGILLMQDDGIIAHGVISCDEDDDDDDVEYDDDPSGGGGKSLAVALQRAAGRHQHFVGRSVGFSMSPTEFTVGGRGRGREERTKLESRKAAGLTMGIGRVVGGSAAAGAGYLVLKA